MSRKSVLLSLLVLGFATLSPAQNAQTSLATVTVPRMVQYSGVLKINQSTLAGRVAGVTFALYKEQRAERHFGSRRRTSPWMPAAITPCRLVRARPTDYLLIFSVREKRDGWASRSAERRNNRAYCY
jgi:hypothetical protein